MLSNLGYWILEQLVNERLIFGSLKILAVIVFLMLAYEIYTPEYECSMCVESGSEGGP